MESEGGVRFSNRHAVEIEAITVSTQLPQFEVNLIKKMQGHKRRSFFKKLFHPQVKVDVSIFQISVTPLFVCILITDVTILIGMDRGYPLRLSMYVE